MLFIFITCPLYNSYTLKRSTCKTLAYFNRKVIQFLQQNTTFSIFRTQKQISLKRRRWKFHSNAMQLHVKSIDTWHDIVLRAHNTNKPCNFNLPIPQFKVSEIFAVYAIYELCKSFPPLAAQVVCLSGSTGVLSLNLKTVAVRVSKCVILILYLFHMQ